MSKEQRDALIEACLLRKGTNGMSLAPAEKRWKVVCKTCGATEEGSDGEIPLRLHGRMKGGQWQHYVANAFTAFEWCGPVVAASEGGGT